jgi:hypothetical protein
MNDRVRRVHCSNGFCKFDSYTTTNNMFKITHKEYTSILNTVFNEEVQPSLNELNQLY